MISTALFHLFQPFIEKFALYKEVSLIKETLLSGDNQNKVTYAKAAISLILFTLLVLVLSRVVPPSWDWQAAFRPAALKFLAGENPYSAIYFYNPPWILIFLAPLALLPIEVGSAILSLLNLILYGFFAYRTGVGKLASIAILFSPPVIIAAISANIDWVIPLGLMLPPQVGLFFVLVKPQIGFGVAIYWLWEAWQQGGLRKVIVVFAPVSITFVLSLLLYGLYPLRFASAINYGWNYSLWPFGVPFGFVLLVYGIARRKRELSAVASTLMTPYLNFQSYAVSLFLFLPNPVFTILFCIAHWLVFFFVVLKGYTVFIR